MSCDDLEESGRSGVLVWGSHIKFEMPRRRERAGSGGQQMAPKATVAVCSWQGSNGPGLGGVERRGAWLPLLLGTQAARSRASYCVLPVPHASPLCFPAHPETPHSTPKTQSVPHSAAAADLDASSCSMTFVCRKGGPLSTPPGSGDRPGSTGAAGGTLPGPPASRPPGPRQITAAGTCNFSRSLMN